MKKLTFIPVFSFIIFAFMLSGCSQYQYIGLKEHSTQNTPASYVSENDTVKVTYDFTGYSCPVTITVFNKLNKPIYIDWSQSSVIMNGNRTALWSNTATVSGSTSNTQINWSKIISTSSGDFSGVMYKDERISFLPPHSYIRVTRTYLVNNFIKNLNRKESKYITLATESGDASARMFTFSDKNSPMKFRVFLSVSTNKEFSKPMYMEKSFWVNTITQTATQPSSLVNKQDDQCHVRRTTGFGTFMGVVIGVGALVLVAAIPH